MNTEHATAKKFTMYVRRKGSDSEPWAETYTESVSDPEQYGRAMIDRWNDTLRPHETAREFVRVEIHGEIADPNHRWSKTNLMTKEFRGRPVDMMQCTTCKITGKRFTLGGGVKIDSAFRGRVYLRCDTALAKVQAK